MARRQKSAAARKKAADVLRQLRAAGVDLVNVEKATEAKATPPKGGTRLTAATVRDIGAKGIDFTAWGAWTLRF